ncbi:MAG: hypothetical protein U9N34_02235, partial [Candidatus Cloacimonadota bacterium]|nr:hypothetical protein [Candidatus Cloacimonadota bacterium]
LTEKGQEHCSYNWIITNQRYVKKDSTSYKIPKDYMGFFPHKDHKYSIDDLREYNMKDIEALADTTDIAYFTDTYGIYVKEWFEGDYVTEFSSKIYGGMTNEEADYLIEMKKRNKPVILEFNTFASPTPFEIRKKITDEFELEWSGWNGRYFDTLDSLKNKELPDWMIERYEEQYKTNWDFHDAGIAFVNISGKILILESGRHLKFEAPMIITDSNNYRKYYDIPQRIVYPFWFDIISSKRDAEKKIVSRFQLYPNTLGDSLLADHNIPSTFPAVISHNTDYKFFYFAGDFADNKTHSWMSYFKYIDIFFKSFLYNPRNITNRNRFFWKYYNPMMKVIMRDYYKEMKKELSS